MKIKLQIILLVNLDFSNHIFAKCFIVVLNHLTCPAPSPLPCPLSAPCPLLCPAHCPLFSVHINTKNIDPSNKPSRVYSHLQLSLSMLTESGGFQEELLCSIKDLFADFLNIYAKNQQKNMLS